jgi:hypothetical protein
VPRIVQRNELARASAWMSSASQVATISGPAVGGLLFGYLGAATSAGVACVFLLLGFASMLWMRSKPPAPQQTRRGGSIKSELLSGAAFVFKHPILFPALTLDMVSVLFGGVTALLPIFASDILHVGPKGLGALRAAPAIGAAAISLWLARRGLREKAGVWLFSAVAGFGLSILVFGLSHSFLLSLAALALSGAFDSVSMIVRSTAVQLVSPDAMRGRISAVNSIFIGSSNEIGEFESGVAARLIGTVPAVLLGAGMCLLTVAGVALWSPTLRRLHLGELEESKT